MSKDRDAARQASRRHYQKHRARLLEERRRYRQENRAKVRAYTRKHSHGTECDQWFEKQWLKQDGRCYLCAREINPEDARIDHDHACCPPARSCSYCRRGLACQLCNTLVGMAHDDPKLLRKIADRFEPVLNETRERMASKPVQLELPGAANDRGRPVGSTDGA